MEFNVFDKSRHNSGIIAKRPRISFYKGGYIAFNRSACEVLGIVACDKVAFLQDKSRPKDWYVKKLSNDAENGIWVLGKNGDASGILHCYSTDVLHHISLSVGVFQSHSRSFLLASKGEDGVHAIFTSSANTKLNTW